MHRGDLTNDQWKTIRPLIPENSSHAGRPPANHRRVLNGILWIMRTGATWRDMPKRYGKMDYRLQPQATLELGRRVVAHQAAP